MIFCCCCCCCGWFKKQQDDSKCSTCIEETLGIKHGVQFGKHNCWGQTGHWNILSLYLLLIKPCQHYIAFDLNVWKKCLHHTLILFNLKVFICLIRNNKTKWRLVFKEITSLLWWRHALGEYSMLCTVFNNSICCHE